MRDPEVLERPGVVEDISSAYDSPETTLGGMGGFIPGLVTLRRGPWPPGPGGPLVTDDRPLPEYFLLRRLFGWGRE